METISNTLEYLIQITNFRLRNVLAEYVRKIIKAFRLVFICRLKHAEPTCGWFVILNTIVLNIKKHHISNKKLCQQQARQAHTAFVKQVLNRWKFCYLSYRLRCMGADTIFTKNTKLTRNYLLDVRAMSQGEGVTRIYRLNHNVFNCWFYLQGQAMELERLLLKSAWHFDNVFLNLRESNEILTIIYRSSLMLCHWRCKLNTIL